MSDDREVILDAIRKAVSSGVEIEERGINRYIIHTKFSYPDGDELRIILKHLDGEWLLTDEGHTMTWLSYDDLNLETEARYDLLSRTLESNHAKLTDGRIHITFKPEEAAGAIHSMIQVLIQTASMIYTNREAIRSTFVEDLQTAFVDFLRERPFEINKIIKNKKGEKHKIDIYVDGPEPLYVFAVNTKEKCLEALLTMVTLSSEDKIEFNSMVIIDENAPIPQTDRNRIINRSDKAFIGLDETHEGIGRYLVKHRYANA